MKKIIGLLLIALLSTSITHSQSGEFKTYPNGLIYNNETMDALSTIVDSLNLQFQYCDLNKNYKSLPQTLGHIVTFKGQSISDVEQAIASGADYPTIRSQFPEAETSEDVLVVKHRYTNYKNEQIVEVSHFDLHSDYGFSIESQDSSLFHQTQKGEWLLKRVQPFRDSAYLKGFFFPTGFNTISLPESYAQWIGYSNCLIDTTSAKFKEDLYGDRMFLPKNWENYSTQQKKDLLDTLRSTRVVGWCSMDSRPRKHAVIIAMLSAQTAQWGVFLKAHLDVMNDRFDRVIDASYAFGARETYIKELEDLNIQVQDLLLGISARVSNPAVNHYYGSINRVGRALAETKDRKAIETRMIEAISDDKLDLYNRLLFYFLFKNYAYHLTDLAEARGAEEQIVKTHTSFPESIQRELEKEEIGTD